MNKLRIQILYFTVLSKRNLTGKHIEMIAAEAMYQLKLWSFRAVSLPTSLVILEIDIMEAAMRQIRWRL